MPYQYIVTESSDGTFTTTIICSGFETVEDAEFFTCVLDGLISKETFTSFEIH
tara:strand:- start:255 stop:413 length:159 start_codon:yes stop_codon:yes gene_type:complete